MAQQHEHHHRGTSDSKAPETGNHACCAHRPKAPETTPVKAGKKVIYVCPMHPQVRKDGPGTCPICGMALEP